MTVRTATGLISWYMRLCGFAGWTRFWDCIYVLPGHEHDQIEEWKGLMSFPNRQSSG